MSPGPSESNARGDLWLSAFFLAFFAGMAVVALSYPGASRTLPVIVGAAGAALSGIEIVRTARRLGGAPARSQSASRGQLVMFGWLAGGVGIVAALGVLSGAALFVGAFLHFKERERWSTAVLAALTLAAVLHLTLERALGLQLFEGVLLS